MTDKQRIEILKIVKIDISNGEVICVALDDAISNNGYQYFSFRYGGLQRVKRIFPELRKHKPKNKVWGEVWWEGECKAIRIKVLNSMITEIKAKSND